MIATRLWDRHMVGVLVCEVTEGAREGGNVKEWGLNRTFCKLHCHYCLCAAVMLIWLLTNRNRKQHKIERHNDEEWGGDKSSSGGLGGETDNIIHMEFRVGGKMCVVVHLSSVSIYFHAVWNETSFFFSGATISNSTVFAVHMIY